VRILLVAAVAMEVAPVVARFGAPATVRQSRLTRYAYSGHDVDLLLTGVGMVAAAAWCSRVLAAQKYDLAFNVGVCGSFDPALKPGTVVHVVKDRIAELGAEDGEEFLSLAELGLLDQDEWLFAREELVNVAPPVISVLQALPAVSGITVNTVHGNERSIEAALQRFTPQVETMEGGAFIYACMIHGVPFAQVRAVSNMVERRNRGGWQMSEAIARLAEVTLRLLEDLR
jgi:futalosine hydrolase